jgi:3-deoxy-manno-octulosonate cytidylyltransferase (CMP-KDO synthetase)
VQLVIVIPARMASTRFPGKPLKFLAGKPMVQWVYEAAMASGITEEVWIATPDDEILEATENFGGRAIRTRLDHPSGTDRLAEVATQIQADIYVNVQGDEPLISPDSIRTCAETLAQFDAAAASLYTACPDSEIDNPAVVKVVVTSDQKALYFSRHAIPFPRIERRLPVWKHLGLYAYRPETLRAFVALAPSPLELTEGLEQLRLLEHGYTMAMGHVEHSATGVDTPEQAVLAEQMLRERK